MPLLIIAAISILILIGIWISQKTEKRNWEREWPTLRPVIVQGISDFIEEYKDEIAQLPKHYPHNGIKLQYKLYYSRRVWPNYNTSTGKSTPRVDIAIIGVGEHEFIPGPDYGHFYYGYVLGNTCIDRPISTQNRPGHLKVSIGSRVKEWSKATRDLLPSGYEYLGYDSADDRILVSGE
jgi:hypothetical protein